MVDIAKFIRFPPKGPTLFDRLYPQLRKPEMQPHEHKNWTVEDARYRIKDAEGMPRFSGNIQNLLVHFCMFLKERDQMSSDIEQAIAEIKRLQVCDTISVDDLQFVVHVLETSLGLYRKNSQKVCV